MAGLLTAAMAFAPVVESVPVGAQMLRSDSGTARSTRSTRAAAGSPKAAATGSPSPQADLFVDDSNTTGNEDGSATAPYSTIMAAVDAAQDGATIAVAAGTYPGNIRIAGRAVSLLGGYSADFRVRDPATDPTTLLGDGTDAVVTLIDSGTSTVDGFTITGGTNSSVPEYGDLGGGLYVTGRLADDLRQPHRDQ